MISTAVSLYEITGDGAYLTKAKAIYDWVRANLVNTSSGVVNECIAFPDHFLNTVPIVANNQERGSSYQYWLFKGISDFCTDADLCGKYDAYMLSNAAQAWSERNSAGLTWNDWTQPTNDSNPDAFEMNGMVGLFQVLPTTAASPFSGAYQIQSAASGMSLGVQDDSTANAAPVVQNTDTGDASASWTLVPESNGYYEIKNSSSGQLLNVTAASGAPGALVVQWPVGGLTPGNDQWMPIRNSDGTYSFYNRNSQLALDDPAGSTAAATQFEQWPQNDTANQKFTLISRATGTSPSGGSGAVTSGIAGKCLDLDGGDTTNGTPVQLWSCNGSGAQSWTAPSDGTLQTSRQPKLRGKPQPAGRPDSARDGHWGRGYQEASYICHAQHQD